ncbi:hypothetical protein D3C78_958600 [compost metagenome]
MRAGQVAGIALAQPVDHRRIGLQQHAQAQTADEQAGDRFALFGNAGFLLHQRGHDQRLIGLAIGQSLGTLAPLFIQHAGQALVGLAQQVDVAHAAHVAIGVGEEASFRMLAFETEALHHGRIVQAGQGLLQALLTDQRGAQLLEAPAFDQGQAVLHHLAAPPQIKQVAPGLARGQAIFAAVQGLAVEIEAPVQAQPEGAIQHALVFEPVEHAAGRGARGHLDQALLGNRQRPLQGHLLLPAGESHEQPRQQQATLQQVQQGTFHNQPSTRSPSRPCSLRVRLPTGQTWSSSATTGQMPNWLLHRNTSSAASNCA